MLEHGYQQGKQVKQILIDASFDQVETREDYAGNPRVTFGQKA